MYCSRADIEAKRLPAQNLIQLTDDEMIGEWDDSENPRPVGNTAWLKSDASTPINKRVQEAIEDAVNEIHFYISARYAIPLPITLPIPQEHPLAIIHTICVSIAVYNLFMRRNAVEVQNNIVDTALLGYKQAVEKLKMIAEGRYKLDAPTASQTMSITGKSAVSAEPSVFRGLRL